MPRGRTYVSYDRFIKSGLMVPVYSHMLTDLEEAQIIKTTNADKILARTFYVI